MKLDTMNQMFLGNYIKELENNDLTSFGHDEETDKPIEVVPILLEYFELYKDRKLKEKKKYRRVIEEKSRGWHIGEQELVPIEAVKEILEDIYWSEEDVD